jgi:hypothetical protein
LSEADLMVLVTSLLFVPENSENVLFLSNTKSTIPRRFASRKMFPEEIEGKEKYKNERKRCSQSIVPHEP